MCAQRTVVVGTDGSDSSLRAVDRAAAIAGSAVTRLVLACASHPATEREVKLGSEVLRDEAHQVGGSAPAEDTPQAAHDRAVVAGAHDIVEIPVTSDVSRKATCDVLIVHTVR